MNNKVIDVANSIMDEEPRLKSIGCMLNIVADDKDGEMIVSVIKFANGEMCRVNQKISMNDITTNKTEPIALGKIFIEAIVTSLSDEIEKREKAQSEIVINK